MITKLRRLSSPEHLRGRWRELEGYTLRHAHHFIISRWKNLREVRAHALSWTGFVLLLAFAAWWQSAQLTRLYAVQAPARDTTYSEGVAGVVDNLNPIFASSPAERSASRLLFANLLTYDDRGQLTGELAHDWSVDGSGRVYTVHLRTDARWQDGEPITAADVVYTLSMIQDASTHSPLYSNWRSVTIERIDDQTVRFTLPAPYAPFPNSLVLGIIPQHVLGDLQPSALRASPYSRRPSPASGPFAFQDMSVIDANHTIIRLNANQGYFRGGPSLAHFQLYCYKDQEQLSTAFRAQEVAAVSGLSAQQLALLGPQSSARETDSPLYNGVYAFLKTDSPLLQDTRVRQALAFATDRPQLLAHLGNHTQALTGPLLPEQMGYQREVHESDFDPKRAAQLLDDAGFHLGANGKRVKDGQPLTLRLVTVSSGDYPTVAKELMAQWSRVGVSFSAQLVRPEDLQQNAIVPRDYDVLIYEIALGYDSDVFAYWHSSQINSHGFNLSDYRSGEVDDTLDGARSRLDPALREAKYRAFAQTWVTDVPAVALYRPSLSYLQNQNVTSFPARPLVDQADRYANVLNWSADTRSVWPTR